jgi:hypothetical protein
MNATKKNRPQSTCTCDAYRFPHREHSGKCNGADAESEYDAGAEWDRIADKADWDRERRNAVRYAF